MMVHLQEKGIAENTLILFLGDNGSDAPLGNKKGYTSSAPLREKKGSEYEGGMRVPFIACRTQPDGRNKWQKQLPIQAEGTQRQMGTVMDLYPTLVNLAGAKLPEHYTLDGYNLHTQPTGQRNENLPEMLLIHFPHEHRGSYFTTYRKENWKLIYYYTPKCPTDLYANFTT